VDKAVGDGRVRRELRMAGEECQTGQATAAVWLMSVLRARSDWNTWGRTSGVRDSQLLVSTGLYASASNTGRAARDVMLEHFQHSDGIAVEGGALAALSGPNVYIR
jgi:hypothetical protein